MIRAFISQMQNAGLSRHGSLRRAVLLYDKISRIVLIALIWKKCVSKVNRDARMQRHTLGVQSDFRNFETCT